MRTDKEKIREYKYTEYTENRKEPETKATEAGLNRMRTDN